MFLLSFLDENEAVDIHNSYCKSSYHDLRFADGQYVNLFLTGQSILLYLDIIDSPLQVVFCRIDKVNIDTHSEKEIDYWLYGWNTDGAA